MSELTIIIPTLDEGEWIEQVLDRALAPPGIGAKDVLVVDGGSQDNTIEVASQRVPTITGPRGRASQMNLGAQQARSKWLLFCHGDSLLPSEYPRAVRETFQDRSIVGGTFTPRYRPGHPWLTLAEWLLRLPTSKLIFGDSALFVRHSDFETVGGFPDIPLMEDLELVQKLGSLGRWLRRPEIVVTTSRRFMEHGVLRQLLLDLRLLTAYHLFRRRPEDLAPIYWQTDRDRPAGRIS
ncbi:MAG: TIGR04283 family arsenosugar biosynthesis glycosyltransferase [Anaerolineales bacterium]